MAVGVFRDQSTEEIIDIIGHLGLHGAREPHGEHTPEDAGTVAAAVKTLILATTVEDLSRRCVDEHPAAVIMLDGPASGSGEPFDWATVGDLVTAHRILLAAGASAGPRESAGLKRAVRLAA